MSAVGPKDRGIASGTIATARNIGMVMGLMPVVGVTLPFISYGGSSIITMMAGVGLLLNVSMRRFMFEQ